jgi:hypothetical protein
MQKNREYLKGDIDFTPWMCSWANSAKRPQGFPRRFWGLWCNYYRLEPMLHLFCGTCGDGYTRVDVDGTVEATLVGDFQEVTIPKVHRSAFADPPYTQELANVWEMRYPKPSKILQVMKDACLPGSILGVLHLQVIRPIVGVKPVAWHPVFCGTTKHIRCLSVFRALPEEAKDAD